KDHIFVIDKSDKVSVITELAAKSLTVGHVRDPDDFYKALVEREMLMSTGVGLGVAVPHAKLPSIDDFFVTVGLLQQPVEWDAIDHKPVRIVFLIGGPEGEQGSYLRTLARIMLVIKNDETLSRLKTATTVEEVAAALSS
ncbi:MAG TPA: PTS sugar transporter subunit IIA, partial [Spirochaetia bacterium]|nr:PTS sugar transporter subunit IIA [Spirochaetia bacterium]